MITSDLARRHEILGIKGNYEMGGTEHFNGLDYDGLKMLADEGLIELNSSQNYSPTTAEFLEFLENHKEFKVFGYAVEPRRSDCRITIEGIKGTAENMESWQDFIESFHNADEFDFRDKECRAWWD